jgi:hypothetical protein
VGILAAVVIRTATKAQLAEQSAELIALRGGLTQDDWVVVLGIPKRTYHRYERGQRVAPEHLMKLARLSTKRGRKKKRGA